MKSHNCHVLMTHMIPIAIRGILPEYIRHTITKLCVIAQLLYLIYILDLVLGRDFGPWVLLGPKLKSYEMKGAPSFPFICTN